MTVIAFLIFPARTNNFNVESLRGQAIAKQLRDTVSHVQSQIGKRLFEKSLRYIIFEVCSVLFISMLVPYVTNNLHILQEWIMLSEWICKNMFRVAQEFHNDFFLWKVLFCYIIRHNEYSLNYLRLSRNLM